VSVYAVFEVDVHHADSDAYAAYRAAVPVLVEPGSTPNPI